MSPAESQRFLGRLAAQQPVDQARGKSVSAADPVEDIQFGLRSLEGFSPHPQHGTPGVPVGRVDFSKSCGNRFDVGQLFRDSLHHPEESTWIELADFLNVLAFDAQPHLQVLFVADQDVAQLDDLSQRGLARIQSSGNLPQLRSIVQVKADDRSRFLRSLHSLDNDFGRRRGQSGEDAATVKPAAATGKDRLPVDVALLELSGGFVRPVVKNNGSTHAAALVAVDSGHVRAVDSVVLVHLVKRRDPHCPDTFLNQLAERVVHHRGRDAGVHFEAVGEIRRTVELATADMDRALSRFAERDSAWINPVDHGTQGKKVEATGGGNVQHVFSFELSEFLNLIDEAVGPAEREGTGSCRERNPHAVGFGVAGGAALLAGGNASASCQGITTAWQAETYGTECVKFRVVGTRISGR